MTTPRDAIAGLSERINLAINRLIDGEIGDGDIEVAMLAEAATAADELDSLLKERFKLITDLADMKSRAISAEQERDALQARVKELESGIAHAQYRSDNCDAENQSLYNRLEAVESRALRAEQERDVFEAQLPDGMKHCTITFHECEKGHGWLSATNWIDNGCLCCQRDEAYERAAKEAESHCYGSTGRAIGKRIRRLAGPEKEGK